MSEKPHTVAIGAFVLGAILIAGVTLVYLLGSGFGERERVVMVFDASVKGLNIGAPMTLRGVRVGVVTNIELLLHADATTVLMLVEADLDAKNIRRFGAVEGNLIEELIARGMRAQLNTQSLLTGLLYVELDFFPDSPLNLAKIDSPYIQLPTIPTNLEQIAKKVEDVDIAKLTDELERISYGISTFVSTEEFQTLPANLADTLNALRELSVQLRTQLASSGPKLDNVLDQSAITVANANTELPKLVTLVEDNLKQLNHAIASFERGMTRVDSLVSPDSATLYQLNEALQEMGRAGRSLQSLANTLEAQPESLIRGKRGDEQ